MHESAEPALAAWESFYVIVGSSAAALTGLMFVVITLAVERRHAQMSSAVAAFATPNVVHFTSAFLVSAILSAPWAGTARPMMVVGAMGIAGIVYMLIVVLRARRQQAYKPVLEDWIWHDIIPSAAYAMLAIAGLFMRERPVGLFMIAAATLVMLMCGIHNAWDSVIWNAVERGKPSA